MLKLAVLVSGQGSILKAMIEEGLQISLVIADRECRGLTIAKDAGIPYELVLRKDFTETFDRVDYTKQVLAKLRGDNIDLVAMAGFMTVFEWPMFEADAYAGKILNTHPSLLPSFKGEHAVADALEYGVKVTGCTIHRATIDLDAGPILAQEAVRVLDRDTVETLWERIKEVERTLYPLTIRRLMLA